MDSNAEHALEFLLAFDGRRHFYPEGYFLKFEIKRVEPTKQRPHGLSYSFTLHDPDGHRLIGYDNAHTVPAKGSRFKKRPVETDHWHRTGDDPGQPYEFVSVEKLLADFFDEAERLLTERGIELIVTETEESTKS
jgi:hypothetical protein